MHYYISSSPRGFGRISYSAASLAAVRDLTATLERSGITVYRCNRLVYTLYRIGFVGTAFFLLACFREITDD